MRGIVVDVDDPLLEGRVALHVPKMVTKYDPNKVMPSSRKQSTNTDLMQNDEFKDLVATEVETVNYIWFRPKFQNCFMVPYVGQTVSCYFEDGDPQKPYYDAQNVTLNGEVIPMTKLKPSGDKYNANTKPLIHVMHEFHDGTIVYHDENAENKRFAITFKNNHSISINENSKENSIEIVTESGHVVVLDQKNGHITTKTAGGHVVKMDDIAGTITTSASTGGKIVTGNGKVMIN